MEIRTLKPGEKITENGFYNIPLAVHHNQPCDGPSVTSGVLRTMELDSPADVWAWSKLNDKARKKESTSAMYMGAAMAALIADGVKELQKQFYCLDKKIPKRPSPLQWAAWKENRTKSTDTIRACKAWTLINDDPRPPLTHAEVQELIAMAKVLRKDPDAQAAMDGLPEITMAAKDEETGLWLLARPDTVSMDGVVTDYKKIATMRSESLKPWMVDQRIAAGGWDMQLGFGSDVFHRIVGDWPSLHGIVGQWGEYPYHVITRVIEEEDINMGIFRCRRAVRTFHTCMTSGHWPGPGADVGSFHRNEAVRDRLREEMQSEGFRL